jgi:hypothetical protein
MDSIMAMKDKRAAGRFPKIYSGMMARAMLCCAVLVAAVLLTAGSGGRAYAAEGGGSSFTPGAQGDFAMCYMPAGVYFRNNFIYTDGKLSEYPSFYDGAAVSSELKSKVWFDLLQIVYSSDYKILGGRYFANINIPYVANQYLKTTTTVPAIPLYPAEEDDSHTSGPGDIQFVPFGFLWDSGSLHFLAAQNTVLKTGRYEADKANNTGRNYFSYDELLGMTWLDEQNGHEVSFIAGYMINTRNRKSWYKTGDEFHVDVTLAQYLSKKFGVGAVGYYYQQMTDDKNASLDEIDNFNAMFGLPGTDGFRSKGYAVGPALIFTPSIGSKDVNIIAKWLHEYSNGNRLEGEWIYLSGCVKF